LTRVDPVRQRDEEVAAADVETFLGAACVADDDRVAHCGARVENARAPAHARQQPFVEAAR